MTERAKLRAHASRKAHYAVTVADLYETISTAIAAASGVDIRECSYLGVPVVNIGSRQSGRDRGVNVLDVGYDRRDIARAVQQHLRNGRYPRDPLSGDGHAGPRIAQNLVEAPLHIEKKLAY